MSERCRTCKAEIFWATNVKSGKSEPIDVESVANGNIEVVDRGRVAPTIRHLLKGEIESDPLPGMEPPPRYVSHYATCPDAKIWRANSQASQRKEAPDVR